MGKKKKDSREFWAGDCETDPFKNYRLPKPFIWGVYTGMSFHQFATVEEFVNFIKDQEVIIYFHNGGKFDMHFLLAHINLREEMKVISGRLVVAHIGKCELRDSWNILPTKLADFGTKKEIDYKKLERAIRNNHMPEIIEYLKYDCITLWNAIDGFEREYGRHLTLAGAAMAQWRLISDMKPPKTDRAFFQKFSPYYFGGRVSVFHKGHIRGPVKMFDIRSAYGWAMLDEHPYEPEYVTIKSPKEIAGTDMVTLDAISLGALPWRSERGAITFPDDDQRRRYYVTGHEVIAAKETGSLREVDIIEAITFTQRIDFSPYILKFHEGRKLARKLQQIDKVIYNKLFLTNLYGKFCANPDNYGNYMCVPWDEMDDFHEDGYQFDGMIGPHVLLKAPLDPWQENFVNLATGASITGKVRAHLWRAISGSKNPIYCDTDSLICEDADLPLGEDLGYWNLEGIADDAWIAGKKLYYLKGKFEKGQTEKMASKGVNLKASKIRVAAELKEGKYGKRIVGGRKIDGGEAVKLAAAGTTVVFGNDAPTFSVKKKPKFQTRRIKATA